MMVADCFMSCTIELSQHISLVLKIQKSNFDVMHVMLHLETKLIQGNCFSLCRIWFSNSEVLSGKELVRKVLYMYT